MFFRDRILRFGENMLQSLKRLLSNFNVVAILLMGKWERFYQHCEFAFGGPLSKRTEKEKICNLMSFVGDKGREIYLTFQWDTVQVGSGENRHGISERDILERVAEKFKVHLEAKKNPITAAVKFDRRRQLQGETLLPSSLTSNS